MRRVSFMRFILFFSLLFLKIIRQSGTFGRQQQAQRNLQPPDNTKGHKQDVVQKQAG